MDVNGRHWGVATIGAIVDDFVFVDLRLVLHSTLTNLHLLFHHCWVAICFPFYLI
jgi:hypothetical protein